MLEKSAGQKKGAKRMKRIRTKVGQPEKTASWPDMPWQSAKHRDKRGYCWLAKSGVGQLGKQRTKL